MRRLAGLLGARGIAGTALGLALLLGGNPSGAQVISGEVRDSLRAAPVPGAVVTLMAGATPTDRRTLTDSDGSFQLRAPGPGTFSLDVKAIGYQRTTRSVTLVEGERREVRISLRRITTRLAALTIPARSECRTRADLAPAAVEVWDDAWAALTAAVVARDHSGLSGRLTQFNRQVNPTTGLVVSEERISARGSFRRFFSALPAHDLAARGFRVEEDDGTVSYYAPDAETLVAPEFIGGHCFALTSRDSAGRNQVGLAFWPQRGGQIRGIEGTLWLDGDSRELQYVEFTYPSLRDLRVSGSALFGGRVAFARAQGVWYVSDWNLLAPFVRRTTQVVQFRSRRLNQTSEDSVVALSEAGGISEPVSLPFPWPKLTGRVTDAVGRPVAGATVELAGTAVATVSDSVGAFVLTDVIPGRFLLRAWRAGVSEQGAFILTRSLAASAPSPPILIQLQPSAVRDACPAAGRRAEQAALYVLARDALTQRPLGQHSFDVAWSASQLDLGAGVVRRRSDLRHDTTDVYGAMRICDAPRSTYLRIAEPSTSADTMASAVVLAGEHLTVLELEVDSTGKVVVVGGGSSPDAIGAVYIGERSRGRLELQVIGEGDRTVGLADVDVAVALNGGRRGGRTDATGRVVFDSLAPGAYTVALRRIGFSPVSQVAFVAGGEATLLRVGMRSIATVLATVVITAAANDISVSMREFEARRAAGFGKFITPKDIESFGGLAVSSLIQGRVAGFTLVRVASRGFISAGYAVASRRFQQLGKMQTVPNAKADDLTCFSQVFLNGARISKGGDEFFNIDDFKPGELKAMEFYRGPAETPVQFGGPSAACGTVVIWTK